MVFLYSDIWFLTSGIRALSLGRHCGQIFFIFADFFFGEEKRGPQNYRIFQYIFVENFQKRVLSISCVHCYGEWFMVYSWLFMKYIYRSGLGS